MMRLRRTWGRLRREVAYGALLGWTQEKLMHRAGHVTASDFSGKFGWDKIDGEVEGGKGCQE
jgi:hypothetical protein